MSATAEPAIRVEGLGKCYRVQHKGAGRGGADINRFSEQVVEWAKAPFRSLGRRAKRYGNHDVATAGTDSDTGGGVEDFWALDGVGFDVQPGEVVGIVGRNGAGKSTLLKILSRITEPTKGRIVINGRVASLLEVGTGFHPELTGRENIYLNGSILGMSRAEIAAKFDEIVAFAEIERFLDTPVKRYSSGMYVRLAFAVAAHLEPEILIVDEVLAVGDAEFQKKCLGKMSDVAKGGRTILFVSHNMAAVQSLCPRAILIESGGISADGSTPEVLSAYLNNTEQASLDFDLAEHPQRCVRENPVLDRLVIETEGDSASNAILTGDSIQLCLHINTGEPLSDISAGIHIYNSELQRVLTFHSRYQTKERLDLEEGKSKIVCKCSELNLAPGIYSIVVGFTSLGTQIDRIDPVGSIEILPADYYGTGKQPPAGDGVFWPNAKWSHPEKVTVSN